VEREFLPLADQDATFPSTTNHLAGILNTCRAQGPPFLDNIQVHDYFASLFFDVMSWQWHSQKLNQNTQQHKHDSSCCGKKLSSHCAMAKQNFAGWMCSSLVGES